MIVLTEENKLAQSMEAHLVVGVDIDDTLVQAAWRRRRVVWSLQAPENMLSEPGKEHDYDGDSSSRTTQTQEPSTTSARANYFPASCEHTFGHLPIPASRGSDATVFPHNVLFRTANWLENSILEDAQGYDVVIACVHNAYCPSGHETLKFTFAAQKGSLSLNGSI
jgi:7SK snRNA methylphosphate capping enzyme